MDNYLEKVQYLLKHQKHKCPAYGCGEWMSLSQNLDLHHQISKHKWRLKKYPKFIHSLINLQLVHHKCHMTRTCGHWGDYQAEKWEKFLERHSRIADFVNNVC